MVPLFEPQPFGHASWTGEGSGVLALFFPPSISFDRRPGDPRHQPFGHRPVVQHWLRQQALRLERPFKI